MDRVKSLFSEIKLNENQRFSGYFSNGYFSIYYIKSINISNDIMHICDRFCETNSFLQLKVHYTRAMTTTALNIRCGRVMADNIAYAKFRKSILI